MNKTLVFGTFDGVHDGHRAMLREARTVTSGESQVASETTDSVSSDTRTRDSFTRTPGPIYLVVAVAPDPVVFKLKGIAPRYSQAERLNMLKKERLCDEVILADEEVGTWRILKKVKPSIIALGYDQGDLQENLEEYIDRVYPEVETEEGWKTNPKRPTIIRLSAYKPEILHNKIQNRIKK